MLDIILDIDISWRVTLSDYLHSTKFSKALEAVKQDYQDNTKVVYPEQNLIFNALNKTPLNKVKVVILGQDPYHGAGQAHGLCFSVPDGVPTPPSLRNILKELKSDTGNERINTDLSDWARQGVLLLNSSLTVLSGEPMSHSAIGWEDFTDTVIKAVSDQQEYVVFILWGSYARGKKELIDTGKHLILESAHPSPLSAHRGFFGSRPFSRANEYLKQHGKSPVMW